MILPRAVESSVRCFSSGLRSPLVGRDLVDLKEWHLNDLKCLIWAALDIKSQLKGQRNCGLLQGQHITLLMSAPEPFPQSVVGRAVSLLGGGLSTVFDQSLENKDQRFIEDFGRALSTSSDAILVHTGSHSLITTLADGAIVPTVAWRSEKFSILQALADVMTIYEHFGILSPLTLSWVGPPTPLFNSYLYIMPQFKVNLRFCCNDSDSSCQTSPAMMNVGIKNAITNKTEFHECPNPAKAVFRSDIITTTGHDIPSLSLRKKDIDEASLKYLFLHDLPRGKSEISEDIFRSAHSGVWKSRENLTWMTMAVVLSLLQTYQTSTPQPKWEIE